MEDIVIVGFGGHAKSIADCIERMGKYRIVGYTDFDELLHVKTIYMGEVLIIAIRDAICVVGT